MDMQKGQAIGDTSDFQKNILLMEIKMLKNAARILSTSKCRNETIR